LHRSNDTDCQSSINLAIAAKHLSVVPIVRGVLHDKPAAIRRSIAGQDVDARWGQFERCDGREFSILAKTDAEAKSISNNV